MRLRPVPAQVVPVPTEPRLIHQVGLQRADGAEGEPGGVLVQRGDEVLVRCPDKIRAVELRQSQPCHQPVVSIDRLVMDAGQQKITVYRNGRGDAGLCREKIPVADLGRRQLLQQAPGDAARSGEGHKRRSGKLELQSILAAAAAQVLERAGGEQGALAQRAAHGESELRFFGRDARQAFQILLKIVGVERLVFQVVVAEAVPLAAAGTRHGIGQKSRGLPVLGGEIVGGDPVLLHRFRSDGAQRSGHQIVVVL